MTELVAFFTPPAIMATVAAVLAIAAIWVLTRRVTSEAGAYGRRIAGTMLGAGAVILGGFAWAMQSWGAGR
ncbi:hypothetical protein ACLB0R_10950 [Sphingomonas sp. GlSt437]|uniref:hypothetical protein n=1 Tax=Sphingomonas sp. GlSt437 TaxID=3389970 RepID=UPI003A870ABC